MTKQKYIILAALGAGLLGAAWMLNRPPSDARYQHTDDAYLLADYTNVAPQIGGLVAEVRVTENQPVAKGDLLAVLDDRDLSIGVETAEAATAAARAAQTTLQAQQAVQTAEIARAKAAIKAADAALDLARTAERRARLLVKQSSTAQKTLDEAVSALLAAEANSAANRSALDAAEAQAKVIAARIAGADAALAQAQAGLANARLQLSHARILAPESGIVAGAALRVGAYAAIGQTLLTIVPLDQLYIEANFRETQLAHLAAGQPVTVRVDALPGQSFAGRVASLGPASGAVFSTVAAQNATGNFTKITQRLPVRITLDPDQPGLEALRVGMSATPEIDTRR